MNESLNANKTTLLFFDFLNGHVKKEDSATQQRYKPVIENSQKLLQAAREAEIMVCYAHANHRADNATSAHTLRDTNNRLVRINQLKNPETRPAVIGNTWETEIIDELKPLPEDYMIPKYRWSAFYQTYLDLALRSRGIDTIIISGGSTDVGVTSTIFSARDMDYNLVVASDACTSPEKDNHEQLMKRVFPRMSRVRETNQIVEMIKSAAIPPQKQMS